MYGRDNYTVEKKRQTVESLLKGLKGLRSLDGDGHCPRTQVGVTLSRNKRVIHKLNFIMKFNNCQLIFGVCRSSPYS